MHDDFYFTNKSWCDLAGMEISAYNQMEALFINMVSFEFNVTETYYNKYWNSLFNFIQGMQKHLRNNYEEMCQIAYESDTQSEVEI